MTVLVTGGAGFIGSHVVDALLEQGLSVRAVDALLPVAHTARPDYLDPAAEWIEGDLRDPAVAERAAAGVSAVCHQASMVGLGADIGDIADYVGHNDLATAILLRALAASGFAGRLVLASSMVVYGEGSYRCARHGGCGRARVGARRSTPAASSRRARRAASRWRPGSSRRTRRSTRAASTPPPRSPRSISAPPSPARPVCR